ncbi:MAG: tRNA pseudouridine(38-40) synthase TruA [Chloroflexota bacterium]|nr:tRNA pseudouridine(38-40) synthase TruA [Chloroflexota bacterium]
MRNIKLILEYDGTEFSGSQLQPNGRTVQGELEQATARLTGLPPNQRCKVTLAGRTDSGVHALGQVANFKTESNHSLETFRRGLNALLPFDLAVTKVEEVAERFHARFSATGRVYRYRILNRIGRSALERRYAYHLAEPLTVTLMDEAARKLIGIHDFASFAGDGWGNAVGELAEERPTTVRQMTSASCQCDNGEIVTVELAANAFLPHMVRNIVGTLLLVGTGKLTVSDFEEILAAQNRRRAGPTAPACGLCLVEVQY